MQTQLTVRVPEKLKRQLSEIARRHHLKRSDIVRMALERFIEDQKNEARTRPYDKVKDLIGITSSRISDLGESYRKHLLKKIKRNASGHP